MMNSLVLSCLDEKWMKKALIFAEKAQKKDEVPVGALILDSQGRLLSVGYNLKEVFQNPLGHAEVIAIQRACEKKKSWRLEGCTLYVTLEPCIMCSGLIVQARLSRVVFGALDPKGGGLQSLYSLGSDPRLNHRLSSVCYLNMPECSQLLTSFFKKKREKTKSVSKKED
jgi:tRNA(adenine34) deaminase